MRAHVYDAYGRIVTGTGALENPYTFTGREFDAESGLYFYRARYYDARTGRFTQEDPIGLLGGLNIYAYVEANPINLTDPLGLAPSFFGCLGDCAAKQLGLDTLAAAIAAGSGIPILKKPIPGALGSGKRTSIASKGLSALFPKKLGKGVPTFRLLSKKPFLKVTGTATVGRVIGRFVPIIGTGLLIYDGVKIGLCTADCQDDNCGNSG